MKTSGVCCVPKFRLLVFLGHPTEHFHSDDNNEDSDDDDDYGGDNAVVE